MSDRTTIDLLAVRADGWFERLGEGSQTFEQLCEVVGESFVAFAAISGVRITSVAVDSLTPSFSQVEFAIGESDPQQLPLLDFQRRLCGALLTDRDNAPDLTSQSPSADEIQAYIGHRYLLLAPIFGIQLRELRLGGGKDPSLFVKVGKLEEEVSVSAFRNVIQARIRNEMMALDAAQAMSVDLEAFARAESEAAAGRYDKVVDVLAPWTTKLALMLRTGQQESAQTQAAVVRGMGTLGHALIEQDELNSADEVLRLGVQWAQTSGGGGRLFGLLGRIAMLQDEHGQAIGFLRRAVALGEPESSVIGDLARCYLARERWLATAICASRALEEAEAAAPDLEDLRDIYGRASAELGSPWGALREHLGLAAP